MSTGFGYTELEPVMLDMDPFGDKRDNCIIHMGAGTVIGTRFGQVPGFCVELDLIWIWGGIGLCYKTIWGGIGFVILAITFHPHLLRNYDPQNFFCTQIGPDMSGYVRAGPNRTR